MEEIGKVVETSNGVARVHLHGGEHCYQCSAKLFCNAKNEVYAINSINAKVNDRVRIEVESGISILASVLLFVLPVIVFIIVFGFLYWLMKSEIFSGIGGFGGLILYFIYLVKLNKKVAKVKRFQPVIKEVVKADNSDYNNAEISHWK